MPLLSSAQGELDLLIEACQHFICCCYNQDVFHFRSTPLIFSPAAQNHPTEWWPRALQLSTATVTTLMKLDVYFGFFKSTWFEVMMNMMSRWLLYNVRYSAASRQSETWITSNVENVYNEIYSYVFVFCLGAVSCMPSPDHPSVLTLCQRHLCIVLKRLLLRLACSPASPRPENLFIRGPKLLC